MAAWLACLLPCGPAWSQVAAVAPSIGAPVSPVPLAIAPEAVPGAVVLTPARLRAEPLASALRIARTPAKRRDRAASPLQALVGVHRSLRVHPEGADRAFAAVFDNADSSPPTARAEPPSRTRRLLAEIPKMADMRDIQAPPAPLGPGTWGNIAKGSWIGLLLLAAPWASTYAFGPVDRALGLGAVNFIAELNKISPLLGTPVLIFRDYVMGSIIVWAGLVCVHSGLRSLLKDRPQGDVLALAGLAGLAAVFLVFPHFLGTVLHACGEEAVFRKYLIGVLKEKSAGGALLKSSLIFSAAHILMHGLSFDLLALKTIIGLTLGLAYLKTGSLAAPSAMHGVYNLCILSDGANPGEFLLGLLPCGIADLAAWLATGLALLAARRWLSAPRDVLR